MCNYVAYNRSINVVFFTFIKYYVPFPVAKNFENPLRFGEVTTINLVVVFLQNTLSLSVYNTRKLQQG